MKLISKLSFLIVLWISACAPAPDSNEKKKNTTATLPPAPQQIVQSDTVRFKQPINMSAARLLIKVSSSKDLPTTLSANLGDPSNDCGTFTSRGLEQSPNEMELYAPFPCLFSQIDEEQTIQFSEPLENVLVTAYSNQGQTRLIPQAYGTIGDPPFEPSDAHFSARNFTQTDSDSFIDLSDVVYLYAYFQKASSTLSELNTAAKILLPSIEKNATRMPHPAFDNYTESETDNVVDLFDVVYLFAYFQGAGQINSLEMLEAAAKNLMPIIDRSPTRMPVVGSDYGTVNFESGEDLNSVEAAGLVIRVTGTNLPTSGWLAGIWGSENNCGGYYQSDLELQSSESIVLTAPFTCLTQTLTDLSKITFNFPIGNTTVVVEENLGGGEYNELARVEIVDTTTSTTTTSTTTSTTTTEPSTTSTTTSTTTTEPSTTSTTTSTTTTEPSTTSTTTSTTTTEPSTTSTTTSTTTTEPSTTSTTTSTTTTAEVTTTTTMVTTTTLPGLVSRYSFDGHADDRIGGSDGNASSGVLYSPGKMGQAATFDGSSKIEIPENENLTDGSLWGFTISVWVKMDDNDDSVISNDIRQIIEGYSTTPIGGANRTEREIFLEVSDSGSTVTFDFNGNTVSTNQFSTGEWHHLVATVNPVFQSLFLDGNFVGFGSVYGSINVATGFMLGRDFEENGQFFEGQIDELQIYNRSFFYGDVQRLYRQGRDETPPEVEEDGLAAHYTFDGHSVDRINQVEGVNEGNVRFHTGRLGKAAKFDGQSSITIPSDPNLLTDDLDGFSISVWVYINGTPQGITQIIEGYGGFPIGGNNRTQREIFLETIDSNGRVKFDFNGDFETSPPLSSNTWHLLTATVDESAQKLYLNGVLVQEKERDDDVSIVTGFVVGRDYEANVQYFKGMIDELRIYNRALHSEEIQELYNQ